MSLIGRFVAGSGGHDHAVDYLTLDSVGVAPSTGPGWGTLAGNPLVGHFLRGTTESDSFSVETDATGGFSFQFVAGGVGGEVDLVASATYDNVDYRDSIRVYVRVPDLVEATSIDDVYYTGHTASHNSPGNWYLTQAAMDAVESIASEIHGLPESNSYFLQMNDGSLPMGGTFTVVTSTTSLGPIPANGHKSHALGIDVDLGLCLAKDEGDDGPSEPDRVSPTFVGARWTTCQPKNEPADTLLMIDESTMDAIAKRYGGNNDRHGNHYHVSFRGGGS